MVAVGLWYGRHKLRITNTVASVDINLNAQRYRDESRPIVVPFILHHHLMV
jgi:hypothetical protein